VPVKVVAEDGNDHKWLILLTHSSGRRPKNRFLFINYFTTGKMKKRSKFEELFDISEQKLKKAKRLMSELPKLTDADKQKNLEKQIEQLLKESDQLSEIAESLGTTKH